MTAASASRSTLPRTTNDDNPAADGARPEPVSPEPASPEPVSPEPGSGATAAQVVTWWQRLRPYLRAHRGVFGFTVVTAILHIGVVVAIPLAQRAVVDDLISGAGRHLLTPLLVLVGLGLALGVMSVSWRIANGRQSLAVQADMRDDLYRSLQRLDAAGHSRLRIGQMVARATADVRFAQQLATWLPVLIANIVKIAIAVVVMFVLSPILALIVLGTVGAATIVVNHQRGRVYAAGWDAQQREADMTTEVEEGVTGVRVVRAFGQESGETRRLVGALRAMFAARVREIKLRAPFLANLQATPLIGQVLVLGVGGLLALNGHLTVGTFLAFSGYLADLAATSRVIGSIATSMPMAQAAVERIGEVIDLRPAVTDPAEPVVPPHTGHLDLSGVAFAYPDAGGHHALAGLDLHVSPGETVALVGRAGSGKSTALSLIPRFHDVTVGQVRVDGVDVREMGTEDLRRRIAVVFEDSFLFTDSIAANISYGRPEATRGEIEDAARMAAAHEFITALDHGYDTVVGEQGLTLSGGQRQRVTLARALLAQPDFLLLDDATSSVDVPVERAIFAAIRPVLDRCTTLVVAYRESTVRLADRVVLVDQGRVVDSGSHDELLARSALYRDLFGDEEPAATDGSSELIPAAREGRFDPTAQAWRPAEAAADAANAPLSGNPPTPQLAARLAALPAADDRPRVDEAVEGRRSERFTLAGFIRPWRSVLLGGLVFVLADAGLTLTGPLLVRHGVDAGMLGGSRTALLVSCLAYAVVALLLWWDFRLEVGTTNRTAERMLYALRLRIHGQLQRLGVDYYDRTQAGRVVTRMTSDVDTVSDLLRIGLVNLVVAGASFVGMAIVISVLQWQLALLVLSVVPPTVLLTIWYRRNAAPAYDDARETQALLTADVAESLAGIRVSHAFRRETANETRFTALGRRYASSTLRGTRAVAVYVAGIETMAALAGALVLGVGGRMVAQGTLAVGVLLAFLLYLAQVFAPVQQLSTVFDLYQRARTGVSRITELLGLPSSTPESEHPQPLGQVRGDLRLSGVRLRYSGTESDALKRVDLHVPAGQRLAFVGRTGAGKSTLAKLVTRFYDPTDGQVLVDGTPLTAADPNEYRSQLGYVPQEPFLFSRTIRENISYGREHASDAEVEAAARAVGAHEFISRLPGGYHHRVTERGRSISAGERQLVCLARALLVDPAVLVLDEATSNLDLASERRVNRAMRTASAGRTTLVVAHRPQSLRWTDRVVVVSEGRIVADTTPQAYLDQLDPGHAADPEHSDELVPAD